MPTWKVIRWDGEPTVKESLNLQCNHCEIDADCPCGPHPGGLIIAIIGMGIVFDPPGYVPPPEFFPTEIQCRACGKIYSTEEA